MASLGKPQNGKTPPAGKGPPGTGSGHGPRTLRAGETLLKPGEKVKSVYFIQSGRISLCQAKNGKFVEVAQLSEGQTVGEEAAFGPVIWNLTALALRPTVVLEVPLENVSEPINQAPPSVKSLFKALGERLKTSFAEVKTLRTAREAVPCPPDHVAKVFGVIYHVSRIIGKMDETEVESRVDWDALRGFCFEVFDEPVVRVEDAVAILCKLGYARFDGRRLHLSDLKLVEAFFDYYGSYYFKGGHENLLTTNSKLQKITEEFLKVADAYPVDRGGHAHLPYKSTIDAMKKTLGATFEADQLFRIEQKGLFIKRSNTEAGAQLSFYRPDFDQMLINWKFLREIELWNEKGFVDREGVETPTGEIAARVAPDPAQERKKWAKALESWKPATHGGRGPPQLRKGDKAQGEVWCSVCMSVLAKGQRQCSVCGAEAGDKAA